ncbi:hypothetical protein EIP91_001995 [Steccherinum ochraceum]|uniref:Uncharacterized protein n=1 Tax=Steccherinum ochraceum TaxID=92696 RepID=A0A4V2MWD9_9APHY|nr:hypothetical protein EIP91_001995 [Steccherinum ochraceum]
MSSAAASPGTSASNGPTPLVAQGDWIKNLVHLAKTAELKKHALTLQLQTAHILSAHASLDQKNRQIQDLKEQRNRLESERLRLLNCLREVNEDRDKADLLEVTLNKECSDLHTKIQTIADGDYATAKSDVDRLRQELGQPPLPSLQATIEEKSQQFLKDLRTQSDSLNAPSKRSAEDLGTEGQPTGKRPRGRPKGSKTKPKPTPATPAAAGTSTPTAGKATAATPAPQAGAGGGSGDTAPPAA